MKGGARPYEEGCYARLREMSTALRARESKNMGPTRVGRDKVDK